MENNLVSIYENGYLRGNTIEEKKNPFKEKNPFKGKDSSDEEDDDSEGEFPKKSPGIKKKRKSMSKKEIGGITYDSFDRSNNIFADILREMSDMGASVGSSVGGDDNVFNADEEDFSSEEEGGRTFSVSELKSMTLGELIEVLAGEDYEEDMGEYDYEEDMGEEDEIPQENYSAGGESNYHGDQGNYDGKAKRQPSTTHVKGNGDMDFSKTKTNYDPDDTEGSEGAEHGDQGNYDGKAKRAPSTTHVKANGDADFGKVKTNHKISSGKKPKNYF
jgi:hypothetical protein